MPTRRANAVWNGSLTDGNGMMRMASGAYEGPYSFQSRFEEGDGTNPEELIAAALERSSPPAVARNTTAQAATSAAMTRRARTESEYGGLAGF